MENRDHSSNNKNVSLNLIAEYGGSDSESDDGDTRSNKHIGNDDSNTSELSEMVLKNNIINACAHGPLSRPSTREEPEVTRHMIIDSSESGVMEYEVTEYRDIDSDSDSSSSSDSNDSDIDSVKDVEGVSSGEEANTTKPELPKVKGELGLDDLPPIEDLAISLPAQETTMIGTIANIVDRLVIVHAFPNTPAIDLDSVLFLDHGAKALGKVFDVFGQVTEPHYCVRFNSPEHVRERGVQRGQEVFIAPRSDHTNYVLLTQLMQMKGSDASWLNDIEPPPSQIEYSDDEEERRANRARKEQRQQRQGEEGEGGETSKTNRKPARNQRNERQERSERPSDSSSRFGSGPSRGRNPFAAGSRRNNPKAAWDTPRFGRPFPVDMRTPPPHPYEYGGFPPPPFYHPATPSFVGHAFHFGGRPRMPAVPMNRPFVHNMPTFGANMAPLPPQWMNNGRPPAPGT